MNSNPVFDSVQQLLRQGDTGQALQVLISFLEKEGSRPDLLRTLRVVEANYSAARQQEIKGILEFSEAQREYAKTNDALLGALEDLASGRKPLTSYSGTGDGGSSNVRIAWLVGGGLLLVLGIVAGIFLTRSKKPRPEPTQTVIEQPKEAEPQCPGFKPERFKVMIVQFQNLGEEKRKPELSIQSRIRELTTNNQLATDVEILNHQQFETSTPDLNDATDLGKHCQADLVIWGQFEPLVGNAISVDIHYAFTDASWPPGVASQTFKNVSEIKADQMKINNLDDAVFRICTALALHENRMDLAKKWLNKLQKPNLREQKWKETLNER